MCFIDKNIRISSGEDNIVTKINDDFEKIEPLNMPIKTVNSSTTYSVKSERECIMFDKIFTVRVVNSNPQAIWNSKIKKPQLRIFYDERSQNEGG